MGVAASRWEARECRSEDGVLFASDEFVTLVGDPRGGYRSGPLERLADLLSQDAGDWIEVDPSCRFRDDTGGILVEAGGGSWEGEGFVAASSLHSGELLWVLHLSGSEPFTAVAVVEGDVVAVAAEYPIRNEFRIPLKEPHRLVASSKHEA